MVGKKDEKKWTSPDFDDPSFDKFDPQHPDYDPNASAEAFAESKAESEAALAEQPKRLVSIIGQTGETNVTMEELRQLSFDQYSDLFGVVDVTEALGTDQFGPILEDKERLIGVPFVLVYWAFNHSDTVGTDFATMFVLTADNQRYIINDGGVGIMPELLAYTSKNGGRNGGLVCRHGLRVSEYEYERPDGKKGKAKTFYIDTKL